MNIHFHSRLLDEAVHEFAALPGIGHKTALRLVLHLLRQDRSVAETFGNTLLRLASDIRYCKVCLNICDSELCEICTDNKRDQSVLCVVENIRDILVIENTQQFRGLYHVLGGIISPMDGIGPANLHVSELEERLKKGTVREIILALSATMEGDTTNFYLYRRLSPFNLVFTTLARGVSVGDELEFTDEITLGRSIINRIPFEAR